MTGGRQVRTAAELAVVFTCDWCGQQIELQSSEAGPEVADARAFLAKHEACLHRERHRRPGAGRRV